jgi:hypothetical protein
LVCRERKIKTHRGSSLEEQFHRHFIGYHGVKDITAKMCNLSSKKAKSGD